MSKLSKFMGSAGSGDIGEIRNFAAKKNDGVWLPADGSSYLVSEYPELYELIGDINIGGGEFDIVRHPSLSFSEGVSRLFVHPMGTHIGIETLAVNEDSNTLRNRLHIYKNINGDLYKLQAIEGGEVLPRYNRVSDGAHPMFSSTDKLLIWNNQIYSYSDDSFKFEIKSPSARSMRFVEGTEEGFPEVYYFNSGNPAGVALYKSKYSLALNTFDTTPDLISLAAHYVDSTNNNYPLQNHPNASTLVKGDDNYVFLSFIHRSSFSNTGPQGTAWTYTISRDFSEASSYTQHSGNPLFIPALDAKIILSEAVQHVIGGNRVDAHTYKNTGDSVYAINKTKANRTVFGERTFAGITCMVGLPTGFIGGAGKDTQAFMRYTPNGPIIAEIYNLREFFETNIPEVVGEDLPLFASGGLIAGFLDPGDDTVIHIIEAVKNDAEAAQAFVLPRIYYENTKVHIKGV